MDVRNAQILAMANAPELRPEQLAPGHPRPTLGNRAVADVFEPGSTNKVITAAAALEAGVVTPETRRSRSRTTSSAPDRVLHDAHPHAAGAADLRRRRGQVQQRRHDHGRAARSAAERLYDMLKSFGFGAQPAAACPARRPACCPTTRTGRAASSCTIAYGQGVSVTALQMASVYRPSPTAASGSTPQIVARHDRRATAGSYRPRRRRGPG